ncbi:PTS sugar transporter subunit IIA [Fusobacterium sp.]|uniref:PTS sugar transporter subunit IIA n=1 Tax=Fusobacterium sp. TaxID=68766 RepID=UPI0028FEB15A|nr:PTS sugar transporter subunit IIA [Fusobacterium sp.]MDU1912325.1 PTS sugar transporter subunit IIA [Fusobacterium sp.]
MLKEAIKGRINIIENVNDWKEAIVLAAKPLVEDGSIENSYIDAMIANVNKFGTYIIIAPKVAMPHSRPEDGVNKNCISMLKINEGIVFEGEEEKVFIFFVLGAVNNDSHIETLMELMELIEDEERIEKIIEVKTVQEIMYLI